MKKLLYYLPGDEIVLCDLDFRIVTSFIYKEELMYGLLCLSLEPSNGLDRISWNNKINKVKNICKTVMSRYFTISEDSLLQNEDNVYCHKREWCNPCDLPSYSFCINCCKLRKLGNCIDCPLNLKFADNDPKNIFFPRDEVIVLDDHERPCIDSRILGVYLKPIVGYWNTYRGIMYPIDYSYYFYDNKFGDEENIMISGSIGDFEYIYSISGYAKDTRDNTRLRLKYSKSRANIIVPIGYKDLCKCCIFLDCKNCKLYSLKNCNN